MKKQLAILMLTLCVAVAFTGAASASYFPILSPDQKNINANANIGLNLQGQAQKTVVKNNVATINNNVNAIDASSNNVVTGVNVNVVKPITKVENENEIGDISAASTNTNLQGQITAVNQNNRQRTSSFARN